MIGHGDSSSLPRQRAPAVHDVGVDAVRHRQLGPHTPRAYCTRQGSAPLSANHGSQVGEQALKFIGELYDVEREVADADSAARLDA